MTRSGIASAVMPASGNCAREECGVPVPFAQGVALSPAHRRWAPRACLSAVLPPLFTTLLTRPQAINEFDALGSGDGGCGGKATQVVGMRLGRAWHPWTMRRGA